MGTATFGGPLSGYPWFKPSKYATDFIANKSILIAADHYVLRGLLPAKCT